MTVVARYSNNKRGLGEYGCVVECRGTSVWYTATNETEDWGDCWDGCNSDIKNDVRFKGECSKVVILQRLVIESMSSRKRLLAAAKVVLAACAICMGDWFQHGMKVSTPAGAYGVSNARKTVWLFDSCED